MKKVEPGKFLPILSSRVIGVHVGSFGIMMVVEYASCKKRYEIEYYNLMTLQCMFHIPLTTHAKVDSLSYTKETDTFQINFCRAASIIISFSDLRSKWVSGGSHVEYNVRSVPKDRAFLQGAKQVISEYPCEVSFGAKKLIICEDGSVELQFLDENILIRPRIVHSTPEVAQLKTGSNSEIITQDSSGKTIAWKYCEARDLWFSEVSDPPSDAEEIPWVRSLLSFTRRYIRW